MNEFDKCMKQHIKPLFKELKERGFDIWSEHGEPDGWVNIHCEKCQCTHEVSMRENEDEESED